MKKPSKDTLIEIMGAIILLALIGGIVSCNTVGCNTVGCNTDTGPIYSVPTYNSH
ncbi:MAG: hypothetical protein K2N06_00245 [Oscillospiraceae bacterium]|nr:hypothetical protein [Oscillospiraceae bacterium]